MSGAADRGQMLRLVKTCGQWIPKSQINFVPKGTRGIYALHRHRPRIKKYDVVYVGMADGDAGIKARLKSHASSKRKSRMWTHFSMFEVWPNITEAEIAELEGLFREIYRKDKRANSLNRQKKHRKIQNVRIRDLARLTAKHTSTEKIRRSSFP
jgi:hypothetical protein